MRRGVGTFTIVFQKKQYWAFNEAREYARSLKLQSEGAWRKIAKEKRFPDYIPKRPDYVYRNEGWINWLDWLGTDFLPFSKARDSARSSGITSIREWKKIAKEKRLPVGVPTHPEQVYRKEGWISWPDWLGTTIKKIWDFEKARDYVRRLNIKRVETWREYCKSGKKPEEIPSNPDRTYKNEGWKGWPNFLGTKTIATQKRLFRPFNEAREYARSLKLPDQKSWKNYIKKENFPLDIPKYPNEVYKEEWISWPNFLGTKTITYKDRKYLPFEQAREEVRKLGLKSATYYHKYHNKNRPKLLPYHPKRIYKSQEWQSWGDFLGTGTEASQDTGWSIRKVKELLSDLIKSNIIYSWEEAVLYSFFLRRGLLNLNVDNRHSQFFKNLIKASKTIDGRKAIEDYANSEDGDIPRLTEFAKGLENGNDKEEIGILSSEDLSNVIGNDPLDYDDVKDPTQILKNTNMLESFNVDEEAIQFYINYSINELWKSAFRNEKPTILTIEREGKNGNKYHDTVIETFLTNYYGTRKMTVPKEYAFPNSPTLMQLYIAYKMKEDAFFGNFSGTGAGKTLSAILSSRIMDSKLSVIICPNDVVDQWKNNILEIFPNSNVLRGKDAFYTIRDNKKYQYLILNYDKFSLEETPNLILTLSKQKIEFVILDEIHFVKKRDENSSLRRNYLEGLLTAIRKKNHDFKILGLSATPIVNNLAEGKSLLELITGKIYDDVAITPTIPNAVTLYEKLSTISIRELPKYNVYINTEHIEVIADKPSTLSIKQLKSNPLSIEQFLTDARIKHIVKLVSGQTIIYTEYITNVIEKIVDAIKNAGFSYGFYTGSDRSGLPKFLQNKVQVLIASRPISTGVDGLQKICNRLIINTLPWTNAQYQQLLGRLVRKRHIRNIVNVYVIKASIAGYPYDQLKWNRIQYKRTLADCAIDGRLPEKNLITPQQAAMEAVRWLERLERGEISTVIRQDLNVELTPVQIQQRLIKYGDFSKLNNKLNSEKSDTTNKRLSTNRGEEWREYHRQYREARKTWTIIPYEEIINRIKQLSPRLQIGDFGCGEAQIMEKFGINRVYSFDHVAINDNIIAGDMKKVPIPDDSIDVAVFSLSLMGKNWTDYLQEAKRCLATNGYLLIAETTKSLRSNGGRLSKLRDTLKTEGFEIYEDIEKDDFTFLEARNI